MPVFGSPFQLVLYIQFMGFPLINWPPCAESNREKRWVEILFLTTSGGCLLTWMLEIIIYTYDIFNIFRTLGIYLGHGLIPHVIDGFWGD